MHDAQTLETPPLGSLDRVVGRPLEPVAVPLVAAPPHGLRDHAGACPPGRSGEAGQQAGGERFRLFGSVAFGHALRQVLRVLFATNPWPATGPLGHAAVATMTLVALAFLLARMPSAGWGPPGAEFVG